MVSGKLYTQAEERKWTLILHHTKKKKKKSWIKYSNIRPESIKLLRENIGEMFCDAGLYKDLWIWHITHKQQKQK